MLVLDPALESSASVSATDGQILLAGSFAVPAVTAGYQSTNQTNKQTAKLPASCQLSQIEYSNTAYIFDFHLLRNDQYLYRIWKVT